MITAPLSRDLSMGMTNQGTRHPTNALCPTLMSVMALNLRINNMNRPLSKHPYVGHGKVYLHLPQVLRLSKILTDTLLYHLIPQILLALPLLQVTRQLLLGITLPNQSLVFLCHKHPYPQITDICPRQHPHHFNSLFHPHSNLLTPHTQQQCLLQSRHNNSQHNSSNHLSLLLLLPHQIVHLVRCMFTQAHPRLHMTMSLHLCPSIHLHPI